MAFIGNSLDISLNLNLFTYCKEKPQTFKLTQFKSDIETLDWIYVQWQRQYTRFGNVCSLIFAHMNTYLDNFIKANGTYCKTQSGARKKFLSLLLPLVNYAKRSSLKLQAAAPATVAIFPHFPLFIQPFGGCSSDPAHPI